MSDVITDLLALGFKPPLPFVVSYATAGKLLSVGARTIARHVADKKLVKRGKGVTLESVVAYAKGESQWHQRKSEESGRVKRAPTVKGPSTASAASSSPPTESMASRYVSMLRTDVPNLKLLAPRGGRRSRR